MMIVNCDEFLESYVCFAMMAKVIEKSCIGNSSDNFVTFFRQFRNGFQTIS